MKYNVKEIADALRTSDAWLFYPDAMVSELLTDSRSLTYPHESLFFALRTANNDGHHYIGQLFEQGVRNFVVDDMGEVPREVLAKANFFIVDDTLDALQMLAEYHRQRFDIPVIGITGSRCKTTVK